jgi:hypothetical protein
MNTIGVPRCMKLLYMYFLSNEEGWLEEFYDYSGSIEFVKKYAVNNSKFQKDFSSVVLKDKLFGYTG